ncbi:hypothetical protein FA13DRAFT_1801351 [Coprinellus micaceus]|uniref:Uncharacterized protein n=1 Tax=Coprinellus micaceus TaxID=71717 RepID=A0A4Y7SE71_COPMI|nr:hypothetical protein FA13DRAFT_1801351 [Coprinellus micaceus]
MGVPRRSVRWVSPLPLPLALPCGPSRFTLTLALQGPGRQSLYLSAPSTLRINTRGVRVRVSNSNSSSRPSPQQHPNPQQHPKSQTILASETALRPLNRSDIRRPTAVTAAWAACRDVSPPAPGWWQVSLLLLWEQRKWWWWREEEGPEAAFEPEPDVDGAVEVEAAVPAVEVAVPGVLEDAAGRFLCCGFHLLPSFPFPIVPFPRVEGRGATAQRRRKDAPHLDPASPVPSFLFNKQQPPLAAPSTLLWLLAYFTLNLTSRYKQLVLNRSPSPTPSPPSTHSAGIGSAFVLHWPSFASSPDASSAVSPGDDAKPASAAPTHP